MQSPCSLTSLASVRQGGVGALSQCYCSLRGVHQVKKGNMDTEDHALAPCGCPSQQSSEQTD